MRKLNTNQGTLSGKQPQINHLKKSKNQKELKKI
jgi:hypothetical protein